MKDKPFVEKNEYGYWVGCIEYANGVKARVTNAKHSKAIALEIAERMTENSEQRYADRLKQEKYRRNNLNTCGHIRPGQAYAVADVGRKVDL